MRNQTYLAAIAAMTLGACVGGIQGMPNPGDDTGGGTAREIFDNTVAPKLTAKCASCHVGPEISSTNMWLGPDGVSSYYDTLTNDRAVNGGFDPAAATLLTKGQHEGPAWADAEKEVITTWLLAEQAERGVDTSPPPAGNPNTSARGAEMAFAACLSVSLQEYNDTQAYQVANMNTERGRCRQCHNGGAGGMWLDSTNNYEVMFNKWQEEIFLVGTFQANLQGDNTYKIVAAETKICNKGLEKDMSLGTHPSFDCQKNNGTNLLNLKTFVDQMNAKQLAGGCPAPAFKPPTP